MGMKLFDDAVDVDDDDVEKIEINQEFAKRYEHNKKREDLQKLDEMKKKGLIDSETESESESDSSEIGDTNKFFGAIMKIRRKDPILLQKDAKLFESSDDEDEEDDDEDEDEKKIKKKKNKPMYIKDVNARNVIEEGAEFVDDDEDEDDEVENKKLKVKSFVEEQEEMRREVLAAMAAEEAKNDDGDDDGLLREKKKDDVEEDNDVETKQKLDEYFGEDDKLDEKEKFLKEFFGKKLWIEKGKNSEGGDAVDLSDDEKEIEKQEDYERDFNFRFEESNSDRVLGHSRVVEGSVRKETNSRKLQRERKKERMELAEIERREEVKRLKNLKRKEIQEKLRKIKEIAGVDEDDIPLDEDDLEKDFDPLEFDKKMSVAFGDEYYHAEDVDPSFGDDEDEGDLEKPDFGKEDELLGLPKDWDVIKSKDGFLSKREEKKKGKVEEGDEEVFEEEEEEEVGFPTKREGEELEGKRKRKRKSKLGEKLKKELEEELYKYDYEDAIGDLKTRFKYAQVKPDRYKLSAAEILWLDEQELNQYVSLKKLATYREKEWKVPQMRKQMLFKGVLAEQLKQKKRKVDGGEGSSTTRDAAESREEIGNNEKVKPSRSARRRKSRKEKALPQSRLSAYGATSGSKK